MKRANSLYHYDSDGVTPWRQFPRITESSRPFPSDVYVSYGSIPEEVSVFGL